MRTAVATRPRTVMAALAARRGARLHPADVLRAG